MTTAPAADATEARRYLIEDNGWTPAEFDAFLATMAPWDYPTTTDDWEMAAMRHNDNVEAERKRAERDLDMLPCMEAGEHIKTQRHGWKRCPNTARQEMDEAEERRINRAAGGLGAL